MNRVSDPTDPELLYAGNFARGQFFNPWWRFELGPRKLLRLALTANHYDKSRAPEIPVQANSGADLSGRQDSAKLTWVGQATFAIHDLDDVVLTDPHFGKRALTASRKSPPGLPLEAIPSDSFAVISHSHYDHLDRWTVTRLAKTIEWFVPLGLAGWFRRRGCERVTELGWWDSARRGRWTLTCLPSQHWSRRAGQGINKTLWCAWLLESDRYRYFYAGDTGYFHGFKEFRRRFAPIDVALLPIGSYEPRWFMRYQHMDPAESYRAFLDLGARYMLPMHWGAFNLAHEPVDLAPSVFRKAIAEAGGDPDRSPVLAVGEGWHLPAE